MSLIEAVIILEQMHMSVNILILARIGDVRLYDARVTGTLQWHAALPSQECQLHADDFQVHGQCTATGTLGDQLGTHGLFCIYNFGDATWTINTEVPSCKCVGHCNGSPSSLALATCM